MLTILFQPEFLDYKQGMKYTLTEVRNTNKVPNVARSDLYLCSVVLHSLIMCSSNCNAFLTNLSPFCILCSCLMMKSIGYTAHKHSYN